MPVEVANPTQVDGSTIIVVKVCQWVTFMVNGWLMHITHAEK
jgi:hypothetical protein